MLSGAVALRERNQVWQQYKGELIFIKSRRCWVITRFSSLPWQFKRRRTSPWGWLQFDYSGGKSGSVECWNPL